MLMYRDIFRVMLLAPLCLMVGRALISAVPVSHELETYVVL
jgi:hypothetical protein